jgi:hypothetical protein
MKAAEIEAGNKIIAVFMGLYTPNVISPQPRPKDYHLSWDWLMPVLKKIDEVDIDVERNNEEELNENENIIGDITNGLVSIDIDITFEAVVEFIKWYNENK